MLRIGAYINILIAGGHIFGLFWADKMFEVTGIGKEMIELAQINPSLPYLLTIVVAIIFFIFGLYGLSADNRFRRLPFLKPAMKNRSVWRGSDPFSNSARRRVDIVLSRDDSANPIRNREKSDADELQEEKISARFACR